MTVVGVVRDLRYRDIKAPPPVIYVPRRQSPFSPRFLIRVDGSTVRGLPAQTRRSLAATAPSRASASRRTWRAWMDCFPYLSSIKKTPGRAGEIRAHLASKGTPIGPDDVLIAGRAKARKLTLVTHNATEFPRVPSLKVEDWKGATPPVAGEIEPRMVSTSVRRRVPSQRRPCVRTTLDRAFVTSC